MRVKVTAIHTYTTTHTCPCCGKVFTQRHVERYPVKSKKNIAAKKPVTVSVA